MNEYGLEKLDDPIRREADAAFSGNPNPPFSGDPRAFPSEGDNFRSVPRSTVMALAGQLDSALGLPERAEGDFVTHADWRNYLFGRRGA